MLEGVCVLNEIYKIFRKSFLVYDIQNFDKTLQAILWFFEDIISSTKEM